MYDYIFFDLDGTLTDPEVGITTAVQYSLKKFGIEVEDRRTLIPFIGPPLYQSYMVYYGFDEQKALKAVEYYREYFSVIGLFENRVYDGAKELLEKLVAMKKTLVVATSKPEEYTIRILEKFNLRKYFTFVAGATFDSSRVKKGDVIKYALENVGVSDVSKVVMIGDREHDVLGAKEHGIVSIGVTFGYGDLDELNRAGATYIAQDFNEVLEIIKGR